MQNANTLVWEGSPSGKFSLKSTIQLMHGPAHDMNDRFRKLLRTSPIPQRIRFFLWFTTLDELVTNNSRCAGGFMSSLVVGPALTWRKTLYTF